MLKYVTKSRYWDILDKGIMEGVSGTSKWHLRDVQEAVVYSYLSDQVSKDIAEIGAGSSRLLEVLAKSNRCYAINEDKGVGGGATSRPSIKNLQFIDCGIGKSHLYIPDSSYDIVFSVSVLEHVPDQELRGIFEDCWRILKPNGLMVHLINAYVEDAKGNNGYIWGRIKSYSEPFYEGRFCPTGDIEFSTLEDVAFRTTLASNPDDLIHSWNQMVPSLVEKRKVSQSCTIEMAGRRIDG